MFNKTKLLILFYCCLLPILISCSNHKLQFKILGTFESVKKPTIAMDYFVYVKNFKDVPSHWVAMDAFAKSQKDEKMLYQVFNFIYDEKAYFTPKKINVEDFRNKYAKYCILAYHIVRGVSDNMIIKYPYRDKYDEDGEPGEFLYHSDLDKQPQLPFPLIKENDPKK